MNIEKITSFMNASIPFIKYIVFGIIVVALIFVIYLFHSKSKQASDIQAQLDLYKRQSSGQLSEQEKQLESANTQLSIAQSNFMTQKQLAEAYQKDYSVL